MSALRRGTPGTVRASGRTAGGAPPWPHPHQPLPHAQPRHLRGPGGELPIKVAFWSGRCQWWP